MLYLVTLLQAAPQAKGSGAMTWIFLLAIIVIFYVFMILPQKKKQKQVEQFRNSLQKGDSITTVGGIHGKIRDVKESTFVIEIAKDVLIEIEKAAVAIDEAQAKNAAAAKKEEAN